MEGHRLPGQPRRAVGRGSADPDGEGRDGLGWSVRPASPRSIGQLATSLLKRDGLAALDLCARLGDSCIFLSAHRLTVERRVVEERLYGIASQADLERSQNLTGLVFRQAFDPVAELLLRGHPRQVTAANGTR